ncbi:MAG: hypothetical protein ACI4N1_12945, partial [Stenotrophomonas koreensis]
MKNTRTRFGRLPLTVAVVAALQATSGMAMAQDTAPAAQGNKATDLDRIQVTGSLIRRPDYETTSP